MKRFTPRARGRAGRIKKRTTHITIVVDRLDDRRLEVLQARDARRTAAGRRRGAVTGGTAASRRERVERSRQRAATLKSGDAVVTDDTAAELDSDEIDELDTDQVLETTDTDVETETGTDDETVADTDADETGADDAAEPAADTEKGSQ
jgi:large subunit ribosomal protein L22